MASNTEKVIGDIVQCLYDVSFNREIEELEKNDGFSQFPYQISHRWQTPTFDTKSYKLRFIVKHKHYDTLVQDKPFFKQNATTMFSAIKLGNTFNNVVHPYHYVGFGVKLDHIEIPLYSQDKDNPFCNVIETEGGREDSNWDMVFHFDIQRIENLSN